MGLIMSGGSSYNLKEGDPFVGLVSLLASAETGVENDDILVPEIGPTFEWNHISGIIPTEVDGFLSSEQAKFGNLSIYAKETGGTPKAGWQTVDVTSVGDFTGDFTIEAHCYIDSTVTVSAVPILGKWNFLTRVFRLEIDIARRINFLVSSDGSNTIVPNSQVSFVPDDTWFHIAVTRNGNFFRLFLDGVLVDTEEEAVIIFNAPGQKLHIMQVGAGDGAGTIRAFVDNVRITDGVARYTESFDPPIGPYPGSV
jgi:hypothetical protein